MVGTQTDLSGVNEMEIRDIFEQRSKIVNNNSLFSFEISHPPRIKSVTRTKFSENPKFLKRSIKDLSFTPKLIIKKNPRIYHF